MIFNIQDIKNFSLDLADLFIDLGEGATYNDETDEIKEDSRSYDLYEYIREHADGNFIYYYEADEYLRDFDLWEEVNNFFKELGTPPRDQTDLALFVYEREISSQFYKALKQIEGVKSEEE